MMRKIYIRLVLAVLFCILFVSCGKIHTEADIQGNWQGTYEGKDILFVFNTDKTCVLKFVDKQSNTTDIINGNYELDLSKKPIPMSIRNIPQLNYPLHTIIEFIGDDSIRIADFSPRWRLRPISFSNGKVMNLVRIDSAKKQTL